MSDTTTVSPLRQRMIEDMAARKLNPHTQRSHIQSCKRFAAWLKRSPDTATPDEVRGFQLHLIESGTSICNRNRIMTGVRFLFRVTLRRHDLAAEVWHLKEPERLPPVLSPEEVKRVLIIATSLKARAMLSLDYARDDASVWPTVQGDRQSRGAAQDGLAAFASPQLCDPSARARRGHSRDSSVARTFQARDDGPLQSRGDRTDCQDREPPGGSARAAPPACEARQCGAAGAVATPAMARPALEVADIFRDHGPAWREANRGHVSLDQSKVMSAIERCRTAALGGHVARCENAACGHTEIAYNSCRNRHCPKCQAAASRRWLADREAELLPVPYFHVVYTLPSELRDIAYQNKRVIYDLLMQAAAERTLAIAADPKRLGARIGVTAVLHTWGSALTHHPHVHMIVPGGGLSLDNARWVASRSNFLVHVNVLARLFRGKMLAMLMDAHDSGQLKFFNTHAGLAEKRTFKHFIAALRRIRWVVHCKRRSRDPSRC